MCTRVPVPFAARAQQFVLPLLAALLFLVPAGAAGQAKPLRLASTPWSPFTNAPGQARFALDLVEEAFARLGVKAGTTIVDEGRLTPALFSGEFDGSPAMWQDEERTRVLLFSEPYLENRLVLVGRQGSDVSAAALTALAGRRIVLVGGFSYGGAVEKGGPVYIRSKTEEDSLARLLKGDVDYTLMDELVVEYILNNHGEEARGRLAFGSTPLVTRTLHLAIRRDHPDAAGIIARFNDEIRKMVADRTYHRLLHLDWIRTDIDGDGRLELVPQQDLAGPTPPTHGYNLRLPTADLRMTSEPRPTPDPQTGPRFYIGGNVYESWSAVPQRYKVLNPSKPDSSRSSAPLFRFVW
jgi:polar amino acid transport system substrate-binding protein